MVDLGTVSRNGLGCVIIREDEDDVGLLGSPDKGRCKEAEKKQVYHFHVF
jgi:hypothetical protein